MKNADNLMEKENVQKNMSRQFTEEDMKRLLTHRK